MRRDPWSFGIALAFACSWLPAAAYGQTGRPVGSAEPSTAVSRYDAEGLYRTAKSVALNDRGQLVCAIDRVMNNDYFAKLVGDSRGLKQKVPVGATFELQNIIGGVRSSDVQAAFFVNTDGRCVSILDKPSLLFALLVQSDSLKQTVPLLRRQFASLGERLTALHTDRVRLAAKYQGYSLDFLKTIDQDIVQLSRMGKDLADVTIRFFNAAEPRLIELEQKQDVLSARQKALAGLRDFSADIDQAAQMAATAGSDQSFTEITAQIDKAVRELERSIGQGNNRP